VAAEHRLPVAALALVDIVPNPAKEGGQRIAAFMTANSDGFASVEEAADAVAAYYPERPRPHDVSGLRKNLRRGAGGRLYWHWDPRLLGEGPQPEPPDIAGWALQLAPRITVPVLLVRGEHSDVVDPSGVAELKNLLPQTEIVDVAGAGHMIVGDSNDLFNAVIIAFLQRHMSPPKPG
jgi:pimeloyl-ACP methyl ester carboxylesterase